MLLHFDETRRSLEPAAELLASGWTHVVDPTTDELRHLHIAGLPPKAVEHALDADEIARIDRDGATTLVVLRVPWHQSSSVELPFRTVSLGVLLSGDAVITVGRIETGVARMLARTVRLRTGRPLDFLLRLLNTVAEQFLAHVRAIDEVVSSIESRLGAALSNREVLELLRYQKGLVHFSTALESNRIMLERLAKDPHASLDEAERDLLEDVMVELRQATQQARVSADILSNLMDAFASIISNNLNVVMKFLTSLTFIMTGPMVIASLYGMNVALPGQHHAFAFTAVTAGSFVVSAAVALLFWKRGWL